DGIRVFARRTPGVASIVLPKRVLPTRGLALSHDGSRLICGCDDGHVTIVRRGDTERFDADERVAARTVAFSPDGAAAFWATDEDPTLPQERRWVLRCRDARGREHGRE